MKKYLAALVSATALLLSQPTVVAKTYQIGVENVPYLPYYSNDDGKEFTGLASEILSDFAKKNNIEIHFKILPVSRLYNAFFAGEIDFKFPDSPYWQQDKRKGIDISYSDSVIEFTDGVVVLPQRAGISKEELKRLGTVTGFTAWDYLTEINAGTIKIAQNPNFTGVIKQALAGRVDGVYANTMVIDYHMKKNMASAKQLVFAKQLPHTSSDYLLSSSKYPGIIKQFNEYLHTEKDSINAFRANYGFAAR